MCTGQVVTALNLANLRDALQTQFGGGDGSSNRKKRSAYLPIDISDIVSSIIDLAETFTPSESEMTLSCLSQINLQNATQTFKGKTVMYFQEKN